VTRATSILCALVLGCGDSGNAGDGGSSGASSGEPASTSTTADTSTSVPGTTTTTSEASSGDASTGTSTSSSGSDDASSTGTPGACEDGVFPAMWQDGTSCPEDAIQVHRYSENTFILRQSLCTSFEGPFLHLLFGSERVLLEDTGDGGIPVQETVQAVIDGWLEEHGQASIELVVVSSHGHGDHVAGNGQFVGQPNTTVVGYDVADQIDFFGIAGWPDEIVEYDLGDRVIDVIPIPGHQSAHIALFDRAEGLLLTGDTLYPGRLYIEDFPTYVASIGRLADFAGGQEVCHVLGTHIEMTTTPGVDFPFGSAMHPDEHGLPLTIDHLFELRDAVEAMGDEPAYEVHDDFIIFPV
jgi:hydroxyacylglutathione hydrolase